jgi:hypothetical protein
MATTTDDDYVFQISKSWVEDEFRERYGRNPIDDELSSIKKSLEWGLLTDIDTVFTAAFKEAFRLSSNHDN